VDIENLILLSLCLNGGTVINNNHGRNQDFERVGVPRVDAGFLIRRGDDGGAEGPERGA